MTEEYDEMYPDEDKGAVGISTIVKETKPKSTTKKKETKEVVTIEKKDLETIYSSIEDIKEMITTGSNMHRVYMKLDEVSKEFKKKLLP